MAVGTKVWDGTDDALTLSTMSTRIIVKTSDGTWGCVTQKAGADSHALELYKSSDGSSWSHVLQISADEDYIPDAVLDSNDNLIVTFGYNHQDNDPQDVYWRKLTYASGTWSGGTNTAIGSISPPITPNDVRSNPRIILETDDVWWIVMMVAGAAYPPDPETATIVIYKTSAGSSTWTFSARLNNNANHFRWHNCQFARWSDGIMVAYYMPDSVTHALDTYYRHDSDSKTSWTRSIADSNYPNNYGSYYGEVSLAVDSNDDVFLFYFYYDTVSSELHMGYRKWDESVPSWGSVVTVDSSSNYSGLYQSTYIMRVASNNFMLFYLKHDGKIYYRSLIGGALGAETEIANDSVTSKISTQRQTSDNQIPLFYTKASGTNANDALVITATVVGLISTFIYYPAFANTGGI